MMTDQPCYRTSNPPLLLSEGIHIKLMTKKFIIWVANMWILPSLKKTPIFCAYGATQKIVYTNTPNVKVWLQDSFSYHVSKSVMPTYISRGEGGVTQLLIPVKPYPLTYKYCFTNTFHFIDPPSLEVSPINPFPLSSETYNRISFFLHHACI